MVYEKRPAKSERARCGGGVDRSMTLTVGSLFSGIGGLDLGLEQAGMKTVWQVEFDDWARGKLDENFPHTEKFKDVRDVGKHNLRPVDVICGGFPCQDISAAGKRAGLDGERSGLWFEYYRLICELRPAYVLVENVAALLGRGMHEVLRCFAEVGYDADWKIVSACEFGLPHTRERLFIVAYPERKSGHQFGVFDWNGDTFAEWNNDTQEWGKDWLRPEISSSPDSLLRWWSDKFCESPLVRMDDGFPFSVSEVKSALKGYGNAVCPPVAKWIGERIIEFDTQVNAPTKTSKREGEI